MLAALLALLAFAAPPPISFRSCNFADLDTVSELCAEAFSGPFEWFQPLQKAAAVTKFRAVLTRRLRATLEQRTASARPEEKRLRHALIVATRPGDGIVGFVEVGLLPEPRSVGERKRAEKDGWLEAEGKKGESKGESGGGGEGEAGSGGGSGSGSGSEGEGRAPPSAAGADTDAAGGAPPESAVAGGSGGSVWQDAIKEAERKRPDQVPFLANLVVAPSSRRSGVGRGLVRVGSELVRRRWKRDQLFVAVEPENAAAVRLYEDVGFRDLGVGAAVEPPFGRVLFMQKGLEVERPVAEAEGAAASDAEVE